MMIEVEQRTSGGEHVRRIGVTAIITPFFLLTAAASGDSVPDPTYSPKLRALFDRPLSRARTVLPPREAESPNGVVRCFRYPGFFVKEIDYGEHGDDQISVTPLVPAARTPVCGVAALFGERGLSASTESYFLGTKGRFGLVESTEGQDGIPFTIHDLASAKAVFTDTMAVDSLPFAFAVKGPSLRIGYTRSVSIACSIPLAGAACWRTASGKLPPEIRGRAPPIALCRSAYARSHTPRDAFTVLHYRVTMTVDAAGRQSQRPGTIVGCAAQS